MSIQQPDVLQALSAVIDPNTGKDFVSTRQLKNLQVDANGDVAFDVELGYPAKSQIPALRQALVAAARGDLRQVSDAQHLTTVAEFGEQTADDLGNAPADADIYLVENQRRNTRFLSRHHLDRQADTRQFATRCHLRQGF